jgi:hypothetical protein
MNAKAEPKAHEGEKRPEGIGEDGTITIHNIDHADNILNEFELGNHIEKCLHDDNNTVRYEQSEAANAVLKTINAGIKDEFIKKVMTLRILGPLLHGKVRSHMSIALMLGAREHEVIEAEIIGVKMMEKIIGDAQMYMEKFNKDSVTR